MNPPRRQRVQGTNAGQGTNNARLCFYFFDGETGTSLCPTKPQLEFKRVDGGGWVKSEILLLEKEEITLGRYHIEWDTFRELIESDTEEFVEVQIRLSQVVEFNCSRYTSEVVLTRVKMSERTMQVDSEQEAAAPAPRCCCVPIPLFRLEETSVLKFRAFDSSYDDFVENAEAFLDGIEVIATAVQTPPPPGHAKTTALATTAGARVFKPGTYSARTMDGSGEIGGLTHNQLYLLEVRGLSGYVCESQFPQYLYVCCEQVIELQFRFRPCGKYPTRSLIFVRQECNGIRWANSWVELQGRRLPTNEQGYLTIPRDMVGMAQLNFPGKQFNPTVIDLNNRAEIVTVISVADQAQMAPLQNHQFLDDNDMPFRFRRLSVMLPSGDTKQVITDEFGRFEAPAGSTVYAEDDDFGLATEPLLVTTLPTE
ncbi:MAG TPA: hypothetical protein VK716_08300 [Terracidiphilus sp.]|jgi:hypothetical protein|nr:hypothetical protein [Terracidiphilus sp.]